MLCKQGCDLLLKTGQLSLASVCLILGVMLAVQFRTTEDLRSSVHFQRAEDLTQRLIKVEKERNDLQNQILELRQAASDHSTAAQQLEAIKLEAGLVPLQGKGVIVTVDDTKPAAPTSSKKPNIYLIKDEDLLKVLNELRAAGAEAMSINNQRLIASSEIRTAGDHISVNNMSMAAPFEIKAIGDPATLENSLKMRGGIVETMQFWNIQVSVKQQDEIEIPAYKGSFRFHYAQPVKEESK